MHSHTFTGFIYAKETHFHMTFGSDLSVWSINFNLTGGLTLHLGLHCLLLLLDCLRFDLSICVL